MSTSQIPAHVPADLVRDFDYIDTGGEPELYKYYSKLHDGPDVFYTPRYGGCWVVTRFEDIERIMSDAENFSSRCAGVPPNPFVVPLIEWDGQLHDDARALLAPFFTPKSIGNLEKVSRDLTVSLIEGFRPKGECDFVSEFAQKMPITILMNLLALPPEDTPYLLQISEDIVRSGDDATQQAAFARVGQYLADKILPGRIENPGDDVLSALIKGKVEGGRSLTWDELVGFGSLLIAAGLDTVASMLGFITKFLAEHPEHRRQLIENPALINDALEELMRRHHISIMARVAVRDMDYKGVKFKAGDIIMTPTPAAGIDPKRFPNPFEVDFKRADKKSMVFGRGPHQCIGSFLARTELRVFLQEWLKRVPEYEIKPGAVVVGRPGKASALRSLPLVWKAA